MLRATVELLAETGYPGLLVSAIAQRAGTSKPAIYRRWPSKAHLVHEAVFPVSADTAIPDTGSTADDLREMVRRTMVFLTAPAAKAALPGLIGEMPPIRACIRRCWSGSPAPSAAAWPTGSPPPRRAARHGPTSPPPNWPRPSRASPWWPC
ncbi:bacterial regulatory s, tetR family protein [Mycobacterium sp. MAC_080597_8934]|nr:bacterial regulatory s, tetR family protein [Mycobacterium sp. MAC_080597_8934]